jgi:hypothetical protein
MSFPSPLNVWYALVNVCVAPLVFTSFALCPMVSEVGIDDDDKSCVCGLPRSTGWFGTALWGVSVCSGLFDL